MNTVIRLLFYSLPIFIVVSLFSQMIVSNEMAVLGTKLQQTERRIAEVRGQNQELERSLASLSSIGRIEKEARALNMKEGTSFIAFDPNHLPVALKR